MDGEATRVVARHGLGFVHDSAQLLQLVSRQISFVVTLHQVVQALLLLLGETMNRNGARLGEGDEIVQPDAESLTNGTGDP